MVITPKYLLRNTRHAGTALEKGERLHLERRKVNKKSHKGDNRSYQEKYPNHLNEIIDWNGNQNLEQTLNSQEDMRNKQLPASRPSKQD